MKLKPLKQWVCDTCRETIESADQGWLEWLQKSNQVRASTYGFKVVHQAFYSPRKPDSNCYHYDMSPEGTVKSDDYLSTYVGDKGLPAILMFVDVGPYLDRDYRGPMVKDLREWSQLFKRLHTPYYEEARLYWNEADEDGFFEGANELWIYLPDNLKEVISRYCK